MKAPIVIASLLVCSAAYAQDIDPPPPSAEPAPAQQQEMNALSDDMAAGHAAVQEEAPPAPAEPTPPPRPPYQGKGREGFTFEVGLGLGYTSEYASKSVRLSGLENISIGAFVARDFALLLRLGASVTGRWGSGTYDDNGTIRTSHYSYLVDQIYLAPIAQYFLSDLFMVAGGVGPTVLLRSYNVDVDGTSNGASSTGTTSWGVAGSFRFGVTAHQSRKIGALRVSLEVVPSVIQHDWNLVTGIVVEGQLY